jgi:very-short-patch-repair endonuclease
MSERLLVAVMNNSLDMALARDQHWYRIPVDRASKWCKSCWPPQWLAFYQTKTFGDEAFAIHYYAQVLDIQRKYRWQLFPDQPEDAKSQRLYFQLSIGSLQRLPKAITSPHQRRIVFIPTTWSRFVAADQVNDLYCGSPLEDQLWARLKIADIPAVRQELVPIKTRNYILDFGIYCAMGKIDTETDGDTWHANPQRAAQDNLRDNDLETVGWTVLRFNTKQIQEELAEYCLRTIYDNINRLGGAEVGRFMPRRIDPDAPASFQRSLFDDLTAD